MAQLALGDSRQDRGVCDLPAIQVENGKHGAVGDRVEELVRMPAGGEWARLRFTVPDHAEDLEVRVIEGGAVGVGERVAELAPFVDRSGGLRSIVAGEATRE